MAVPACIPICEKRGAADAAGCITRLCSLHSEGGRRGAVIPKVRGFRRLWRPGSMVRALCAEPWVPPTERAGSEGSFMLRKSCIGLPSQPKLASSLPFKRPTYCRLTVRRQNRKTAPVARRKCTPSVACGDVSPRESVSRNFQSPYGSLQISFACHPGGGDFSGSNL